MRGRPPKNPNNSINFGQSPVNTIGENVRRSSGLKESFRAVFNFSGNLLAVSLNFKSFEIDKNEGELLSEQADQLALEFIPEIGTKWAKLSIFLISLISVFGKKYLEFVLSKENNTEKLKNEQLKQSRNSDEIITVKAV